jgi:hypothetical protein
MNPAPIKASTQDHLDIEDITQNLVILKDGSCALVLQTTAINFSLLSEPEQDATIYAYASLLNSLTFPIQILIRSQRKNINSYLALLTAQEAKITSPKLKTQLQNYRQFVQKTVQENEVLDKKFYIIILFSSLELGITSALGSLRKKPGLPMAKEHIIQRATTSLSPKRDHLLGQLSRLGLKARQLTTPELIKLFHSAYNPQAGTAEFATKTKHPIPLVQAAVASPKTAAKEASKTTPPTPTKSQPQSKHETKVTGPPVAPTKTK